MNEHDAPAIVGILITALSAAIMWGAERQARKDLGVRHAELAAEIRPRLTIVEATQATAAKEHGTLEERMRGLKEQLDRIEGIVSTAAKRRRP